MTNNTYTNVTVFTNKNNGVKKYNDLNSSYSIKSLHESIHYVEFWWDYPHLGCNDLLYFDNYKLIYCRAELPKPEYLFYFNIKGWIVKIVLLEEFIKKQFKNGIDILKNPFDFFKDILKSQKKYSKVLKTVIGKEFKNSIVTLNFYPAKIDLGIRG